MNKFTRGMTYIVTGEYKRRYLVQQTGLKSWKAMVFTHIVNSDGQWDTAVLEGNATSLYETLKKSHAEHCGGDVFEVRAYNTVGSLRRDMFNILKFGKFEE